MEPTTATVFGTSLPGLHNLPEDTVWDPVEEARSLITSDVVFAKPASHDLKQDDDVYPCPKCTGLLPRHIRHNDKDECVRFMIDRLKVGAARKVVHMEWYPLRS
jgi:hypothetical protein